MKLNKRTISAGIACLAAAGLLSACGSGTGSGSSNTQSDASSASTSSSSGDLEFWGWNPAYESMVKEWNSSHDKQVKFETTASGSAGGYTKMQAAVKAGNAPCLAQMGNESITTFVIEGMLEDISDVFKQYEDNYDEGVLASVRVGDGTYGVPVDTAPMGMFYRADVYEEAGIEPAATWEEFQQQSRDFHASHPDAYLSSFEVASSGIWGSYTQQAGGTWFDIDGDSWVVEVDSPITQKIADYWQVMVDDDLTRQSENNSPEWWEELQQGTIATEFGPVWWATILEGAAEKSAGLWRVAPMPNWTEGDVTNGTSGGSTTAVLSGCQDMEGAVEFANWMSTDDAAVQILIDEASAFPASKPGMANPAIGMEKSFFGEQKILEVFAESVPFISTDWQYGPVNTQTGATFRDAMTPASEGKITLSEGLTNAQAAFIKDLEAKGLSVK